MTDDTSRTTRRTVLQATGAIAGAGLATVGAARPPGSGQGDDDTLRVFGEAAVGGTAEVVADDTWAYVATGDGFAVVDWRNPNRPEVVVDAEAPGTGIADVKVEGDLLAVSSQADEQGMTGGDATASEIGTHFYDVSDPTAPEFLGTWVELPAGVHNAYLDGDVAYICREFPFDDSALKIVDVGDPTDPTLLSAWRVEDVHPELDSPTNFIHDVYVQDGLAYLAYWDAGTRVLDVSDPANPVEVSAFGEAPGADMGTDGDVFERLLAPPGNAHYVQPSPDGDHVYVGAETYLVASGGVKVFDVSDLDAPRMVAEIEAQDRNDGIFVDTAHNLDVTNNRLYTSWYRGGARVHDVTDPSTPEQTYEYDPEGAFLWTAVRERGFVLVGDIGGGVVFLHEDRGRTGPPSFAGADSVPHHDRKRRR